MENTLISTTASVMSFDQSTSQWLEMGSTPGVSTIIVLKSTTNQYRYVAIKEISKEIILNCFINSELKYQESTENFHMIFQTDGSINGLNFSDAGDAKKFANTIYIAIEQLQEELKPKQPEIPPIPTLQNMPIQKPSQPQTQKQSPATTPAPSGTIKSQTKSRRSTNSSNKQQVTDIAANNSSQIPSSRPEKQPMAVPVSTSNSASAAPPPPPGPPAPPPPAPPPPGPPPPPTASTSSKPVAANDFASQLKAASLKPRNVPNIPDKSLESTSNIVVDTPPAISSASGGSNDFLSEMRNKFKQRSNAPSPSTVDTSMKPKQQPLVINKPSTPEPIQRKLSLSQLPSSIPSNSTSSTELDKFKKEIMEEIVSNMNRIRDEIIENISAKLGH